MYIALSEEVWWYRLWVLAGGELTVQDSFTSLGQAIGTTISRRLFFVQCSGGSTYTYTYTYIYTYNDYQFTCEH